MNIKKHMLDVELQKKYLYAMFCAEVMSYEITAKIADKYLCLTNKSKKIKNIDIYKEKIKSNGRSLDLKIYQPTNLSGDIPVLLYMHGGGYMLGNPEMYENHIELFLRSRKCTVLAPYYTKVFDNPYPAALEDCYNSLLWAKNHYNDLKTMDERFIVAGASAGGSLAAAVSHLARDKKEIDIAFQMPLYPMLDHANSQDMITPMWNNKTNLLAWKKYLHDIMLNNESIPSYASPLNNDDFTNFPPTFSFVGNLDYFHEEVVSYFQKLTEFDIENDLKIFNKAFHQFEIEVPEAKISLAAMEYLKKMFEKYYDRYITDYLSGSYQRKHLS